MKNANEQTITGSTPVISINIALLIWPSGKAFVLYTLFFTLNYYYYYYYYYDYYSTG